MHRYQHLARLLLQQHDYHLCFYDKSQTAGTLLKLIPDKQHTKAVTLHHNFEQDYFKYEKGGRIFHLLFKHHIKCLEKHAYLNSDINLFLTEEDATQFQHAYGNTPSSCVISGMFETSGTHVNETPTQKTQKTIVIPGSLNNLQNLDGLKHFFSYLYPLIPLDYKIIVTGQKPSNEIKALCNGKSNVELIANPSDIINVISRGELAICPTRGGSGMKIRLTEPLKLGIPIIAHATSGRGYQPFINEGAILTYRTPQEFIQAFSRLQKAIANKTITPSHIRRLYTSVFSHECGINRLKDVLL